MIHFGDDNQIPPLELPKESIFSWRDVIRAIEKHTNWLQSDFCLLEADSFLQVSNVLTFSS